MGGSEEDNPICWIGGAKVGFSVCFISIDISFSFSLGGGYCTTMVGLCLVVSNFVL